MKLALLSDIHANRLALEACLDHARAQGADRLAVLGDSVGYGAEPRAVVRRLMALAEEGTIVLKGNHDEAAVAPPPEPADGRPRSAMALGAQWTHDQLDAAERGFLDGLPLTAREGPALLVHASAEAPDQWHYVSQEGVADASLHAGCGHDGVRYVFGGHVHEQCLYYRGASRGLMRFEPHAGTPIPLPAHRQWLATVGSVGQPRDGDPRAMYAVFDADARQLCFHRVPYDHLAAAAAVRRTPLPPFFADRLEQGR